MGEITISIPDELEEDIKNISKLKLSLAVAKILKLELDRIARIKSIISKSKLSEKDVEELSFKTDMALSKRFLDSAE